MIDLRLNGCGAFGLGFERPLQFVQHHSKLFEAAFDGRVELRAASLGGTFSNGLL